MNTRRGSLAALEKRETTNAGLWLDKFICEQARGSTESRSKLVHEVASITTPQTYQQFFTRWQRELQDCGADWRECSAIGRIVIGLGQESVLETSLSLHHTYGVPYIPGSALKGLAASFARCRLGDEWKAGNTPNAAYNIVFGDTESAGHVTFYDALPYPNTSCLLQPDVMAVHHPDYYRNASAAPPADSDDPNPVPFISATGTYLLALSGPSAWVNATFTILRHALDHAGVGAKTSSGYGRMTVSEPPVDVNEKKVDELIARVKALRFPQVAGEISNYHRAWCALDASPAQKARVAAAIVAKVKEAGREKQSSDKAWYKELLDSLP